MGYEDFGFSEDFSVEFNRLSIVTSDSSPLSPTSVKVQQRKISEIITASQLQFERVGLYGREKETDLLKDRLRRYCYQEPESRPDDHGISSSRWKRELVLIGGHSGTGKSALAETLKGPVEAAGGLFCSGKFDSSRLDVPLAGFIAACKDICATILKSQQTGGQHFQRLHNVFAKHLGGEVTRLLCLFVAGFQEFIDTVGSGNSFRKAIGLPRRSINDGELAAAFRAFFRALSICIVPVVLVLDDLQWADSSSLALLTSILTDTGDWGIMIVGSFRSNECPEGSLLAKAMKEWRETTESNGSSLGLTEISIGNLSHDSTVELLVDLLSKDRDQVQELAAICFERTQGNIFFVRSFLSVLVDENLLKFHLGTFQWDWNVDAIRRETSASPNLVDLVRSRLSRMANEVLYLLHLAACLGDEFEHGALLLVWKATQGGNEDVFATTLSFVIRESVLVPHGQSPVTGTFNPLGKGETGLTAPSLTFRFSHDQVKEAIISLLPKEKLRLLRFQVGKILLEHLPEPKKAEMIFVIATLINQGSEKKASFAEVNLQAGKKAVDFSAFSTASIFVYKGLRHLDGPDIWKNHFHLLIDLHSLGARAQQSLGNYDQALRHCSTVEEQGKATPLEKCKVYKVKLDIMQLKDGAGSSEECLKLALNYLEELGCSFPKRPLVRKAMVGGYMNETKAKFIPTVEKMRTMPMMTDPCIIETVQLLERAGSMAYVTLDSDLYIMIRCRFVRLVGKYGLTNDAPAAFASFANVLMHNYGDFDTAVSLAELSLVMQEMLPSKFYESRTLMNANIYVLCWVRPLASRVKHVLAAYESGMRLGNTLSAFNAMRCYLYAAFVAGTNLHTLDGDLKMYISQMRSFKVESAVSAVLPIAQLVDNLMGKSSNTVKLSGRWIEDEDKFLAKGYTVISKWLPRFQLLGCMYFADYETGANLVLQIGGVEFLRKNFPGISFGSNLLPFGLCCYVMAERTGKAKFKKAANQLRAEAHKLAKHGCVNVIHAVAILDAEFYALGKKTAPATASYQQAIVLATKSGFIQNTAVAHERYGDFALTQKDRSEAAHQYDRAVQCYQEWGAIRVAELLRQRHDDLLGKS